jgi:hypothetical protein
MGHLYVSHIKMSRIRNTSQMMHRNAATVIERKPPIF